MITIAKLIKNWFADKKQQNDTNGLKKGITEWFFSYLIK